jgi:sporulation protein YlmC with PRC-barrel domain
MRTCILTGLLASTLFTGATIAQSAPQQVPARAPAASTTTVAPLAQSAQWRASKLIGLNVYNAANEKIGDINEILLAGDGKVAGVVVGVGGYLGMGEHDVLVTLDQIKFVNEPVRTSSAAPAARPAPANCTGTAANTATRPARAPNEKWYPDHAVMNATKDQLKAMAAFKYN